MTRVLLFGDCGWIGQQLVPRLIASGLTVLSPGDVRADDVVGVAKLLYRLAPDRVVSVIGRTRGPGCGTIDYLEDDPKCHEKLTLNMRDNLFAPLTLAHLCKKRGIHFSYLGTGCIFSYDGSNDVFTEEDEPNFFGSAYSVVKGYTDRLMHQLDVLNVRIRMPITADASPYNFITKIVAYDKICSIENSMTVLPSLLPCFADMIKRGVVGTVNLTNPGTISHNTVLRLYRDIVDPSFTWTNFSEDEQDKVLKSGRSNNCLDTYKISTMYPAVLGIEDAVKGCLVKMACLAKATV